MANDITAPRRSRENRYRQRPPVREVAQLRTWPGRVIKFLSAAAAIILMSLLFVFGHDWLTQCDYFRARTVEISGSRRVTEQQIMKSAKISKGVNILSINLAAARKRLMARPWIAAAEIQREFPGTVRIRVREHTPAAVIYLGRPFLVNTKGEIFMEAGGGNFRDLPQIRGVDYRDWKADGQNNTPVSEAVMSVLALGKKEGCAVPADRIEQIRVDPAIGLTLLTRDFPVACIHLGYGNYKRKYRHLSEIFARCTRNDTATEFAEIDLRNPDRIVARPVSAKTRQTNPQKEA